MGLFELFECHLNFKNLYLSQYTAYANDTLLTLRDLRCQRGEKRHSSCQIQTNVIFQQRK